MRRIRTQEWAMMVKKCQQSGLTVSQWCDENGVSTKTYYYRRKRIREELLEVAEAGNAFQLSECASDRMEAPVFAALPMPRKSGAAITVRIGTYIAEIHNGAEAETVESVLRTLTRL